MRICQSYLRAIEVPVNWCSRWLMGAGWYTPSCPLTQGETDSKMSFTLQSSPWGSGYGWTWSEVSPLFGYIPFSVLLFHSPAVSFSWKHFPNKSRARESSSQVLILGACDQGHKHYSYAASLLKELSSSPERLTYHKLENSRFARIPFGDSGVFVWKDNLINSRGAKLNLYRHECCWCQDFKRRGWNCSAWDHERLFVSQSRKWRTVSGMEGRPGAVWCGMMPLTFNKLANQHADTGAGDERDHKELNPWETMGKTLNHLRPWDQGHLGQVCRLPPTPTRKTVASS